MSWDSIRTRLNRFWEAREAPHITILGQTGSGKSYLLCRGILELCQWDRVLIIDVKGDDRTLLRTGKPVRRIPGFMHGMKRLIREDRRRENWFRLVTYDDWDQAREQVQEAYERVYSEGDWIIVHDELRAITDPSPPGLRLRPDWERLVLRGRSKGIALVNLSQEPRWAPSSFYSQGSFYFFGRLEDEVLHKRIGEIGSSRAIVPHIQATPKWHWIYTDNQEDVRYWARTKVT